MRVQDVAVKYNFAEMSGQRGITQLRWATFGEPSQVNAQPHLDSDGDLVGAHNGNVVNNVEMRQLFIKAWKLNVQIPGQFFNAQIQAARAHRRRRSSQ